MRTEIKIVNNQPTKPTRLLDVNGAHGQPRITTESASIKSLQHSKDMAEELKQLKEDIEQMKNEKGSKRESNRPIDGTGQGLLINQIRATNGIDTTGMSDELLKNNSVNNNSLTYLNFQIRGVTAKDESIVELEKYRRKYLDDTSRAGEEGIEEILSVQMDNGGARTVASLAFANHCNAPVLPLKNDSLHLTNQ